MGYLVLRTLEMRAVIQDSPGSELKIGTRPIPSPANPRDVVIRVAYSALNRMDLLQAKGSYPPPPGASDILGVEVSGTIHALGSEVEFGYEIGEPVMALLLGGGYAEYCSVDERTVMRCLPGIPLEISAAIPEAFMTAYQLLFFVAKLQEGESVLLHASASSVGQAAIQLAARHKIQVYSTARSDDKCARCLELGATAAFKVGSDCKFAEAVRSSRSGGGVHAILDPVGSTYIHENLDLINTDGRIVLYGLMTGGKIEDPTFLNKIMAKRVSLLSSTLRARTVDYKSSLIQALSSDPHGLPAIAAGDIKVEISNRYPIEEVKEAHTLMESNSNIGKIILTLN